ncbi:hypothetical protein KC343_g10428 [Hortaea werneckii]|nr:hypothetical protein KC352_g19729 [Hortaea werneckii]KAI7561073.1 hypothetical protein KC317_g9306 [Hortaea werneckii]KAI7609875.1 hypothetical protein KC346_g8991 [Hortaea werneckii]KAI7614591.1 hypothetical protein KC343_g10428 [Hortaea werneckii]KAI7655053.1 hypothetical protein KC319_g10106 [Hortaea werneckii]
MDGVTFLARKLGFRNRLGRYGKNRSTKQKNQTVLDLMNAIDRLTARYWFTTEAALRQSSGFRSEVNDVLDSFGHRIWPAGDRKSGDWLVSAEEENLEGDYSRDLFYHDEGDQSIIRSTFYELIMAKCRSARVSRHRQSGNKRLSEPNESDEEGSQIAYDIASEESSCATPSSNEDTFDDPDFQPFAGSSRLYSSPVNDAENILGRRQNPKAWRARSSPPLAQRHRRSHLEDDCNIDTSAWAREPSVGNTSRLKRRRDPSAEFTAPTIPTADMSRRILTFRVNPQSLSALLSGAQSDSTTSSITNGTRIKNEAESSIGTDVVVRGFDNTQKAKRHEVLFELNTKGLPEVDLTDETPDSPGEVVQSSVAMDAGRAAIVSPSPAILAWNPTMAVNAGHQSSPSQSDPTHPRTAPTGARRRTPASPARAVPDPSPQGCLRAPEQNTIAVSAVQLGERIANSLYASVTGEASHATHADVEASEERGNEPRLGDAERCRPRQAVGTASSDDEDFYSRTPPPFEMHRRNTNQRTATAGMSQPRAIGDDERSRGYDTAREQMGLQADETRLRGAGGHLASPVSTGAESGHRAASQVADESRHADPLSCRLQQMIRDAEAREERVRQIRQKLREQGRTFREEEDAASRRIAELDHEIQQLERDSQDLDRHTEAVKRIAAQPSSSGSL